MFPIDHLYRSAEERPQAIAVEDDAAAVRYGELMQRVRALGWSLQQRSGRTRPVIAVAAVNNLDCLYAVLAAHAIGAIFVPLNPRNASGETNAQIAAVSPDLIVADLSCVEGFTVPPDVPCFVAGGALDRQHEPAHPTIRQLIDEGLGKTPAWPDVTPGDTHAIKFTGGSSGAPKGVLQPFRVVNALVVNMLAMFHFDRDDVYLCAAPITHGAGTFVMPILAAGGKVVLLGTPQADLLADTLERCEATVTWLPPTLLYALTEAQRARPRRLTALRQLIYGGAPCAPAKVREAVDLFGPVLATVYGQTEAPVMLTAMPARELAVGERYASAGRRCLLADVRIMGGDGAFLPAGQTGEIVVRGDLLMSGYLGMPEATARTLVDGWLHTGDIGKFDADGYLTIMDRIRDVIISGGFNVYPSDVEAALCRHPAVLECVVFGVPDDKWGERVEAAVELRAPASETELTQFAKQMLGSVKTPKQIHIVAALPRSSVGKVLRREARTQLGGGEAKSL